MTLEAVPSSSREMPNLDFLRACAVLFVVCAHFLVFAHVSRIGPLKLGGIGPWGVWIFFVHTSLVLTLSLDRQARQWPGRRLLGPFLIRRTFRIFPLSVVVVMLVRYLSLPVGHLEDGQFVPAHVGVGGYFANLLLVQNITHSESVVAPLWSLPYEMQMYLLLPALFLLARSTRTAIPLFGIWLIGLIPALRPWYFDKSGVPDLLAYAPYFLSGVLAYKMTALVRVRLPAVLWPVTLAAITALYLRDPSTVHGHGPIGALLIGVAIPHFEQMRQPVVVAISHKVAQYSYGIYLTHFICIWLAFQGPVHLTTLARWVVFLVIGAAAPVALYHGVEAPMIRIGQRIASLRLAPER